jgi:unsaturated rhamnogalacturonyl hydrolase
MPNNIPHTGAARPVPNLPFAESIARRIMRGDPKDNHMDIDDWNWGSGVGMYGLARFWRRTGDTECLAFLNSWIRRHREDAATMRTVNHTAPILAFFELHELPGNEDYLDTCRQTADWLVSGATRTRDGGYEHTVNADGSHLFPEQMWADTLFMACIFLARMGRGLGDARYINEAARQLLVHHQILKDKNTGLFYHGWDCLARNWKSGALWGRANAWITASTVEMLEILPPSFEGRDFVLGSLRDQVAALSSHQRANGLFGTLLDDPSAYDETSCAAGISYGVRRGIKAGFLDESHMAMAEKAGRAVLSKINSEGEVGGVSGGTPIMPTLADYKTIEIRPALYGQALALLMLCEE